MLKRLSDKQRREKRETLRAREILKDCEIELGEDFHALNRSSVDKLLEHARENQYRRPANANGSKARYYHDMLQRRARRYDFPDWE